MYFSCVCLYNAIVPLIPCNPSPVYEAYRAFKVRVLDKCGRLGAHYRHTVCLYWQKPLVCLEHFREHYLAGYEPQLIPGQSEFGPETTLFLPIGFVTKHLSQKPWKGVTRNGSGYRGTFENKGVRVRKQFATESEAQAWYKLQRESVVHAFASDPKSKLNYQTKTYLLAWRFEPPKC